MGMAYHRFLRGRSFVRPLRHSFLRDPSRKEGHGERQVPGWHAPKPPQSGLGNGCEIEGILFLFSIGRGIGPSKEPLHGGRTSTSGGQKEQARFHLLSGARASMTMPNGKQCAAERDPRSGRTCVAVVLDGRSGLQYV